MSKRKKPETTAHELAEDIEKKQMAYASSVHEQEAKHGELLEARERGAACLPDLPSCAEELRRCARHDGTGVPSLLLMIADRLEAIDVAES